MNIDEELFLHRQAIINAATEAVLGKNYYNDCCDSWSCTEMCMEDILYKLPFGKKYVKKYREIMAQKNKELDERYKKEMQKYEFHVGDYVETKDKYIGIITKIDDNDIDIKYAHIPNHYILMCGQHIDLTDEDLESYLSKYFNRIGQYDFTKPQKQNKIDPLPSMDFICYDNKLADCKMNQQNVLEIYDKLNEIINYINSNERLK